MPFACYSLRIPFVRTPMSLVYHSCVLVCHSHVTCVSFVCISMLLVSHSYVLICHSYVTCISIMCHSYLLVCHSYALVRHSYVSLRYSYVTRICFYHEHMSTKERQFWQVPTLKNFILKNLSLWVCRDCCQKQIVLSSLMHFNIYLRKVYTLLFSFSFI